MVRLNPVHAVTEALSRLAAPAGVSVVVVHGADLTRARAVVDAAVEEAALPPGTRVITVVCPSDDTSPLALARAVSAATQGDTFGDFAAPSATGRREDVVRDLAEPVLSLLARGPLAVVVDEAQRADDASLAWVAHVLRRAADWPACMVLVHRGVLGAGVSALVGSVLGQGIGAATAVAISDDELSGPTGTEAPARVTSVLRAAAVLRTDDPDLVAALARVPREDAVAVLRGRASSGPDGVRVPQTVLADVDPAESSRLRQEAARLLNDAGWAAEQVARHLIELPDLREAWMRTALSDAAAEAAQRGAPETAVRYLAAMLDSSLLDGSDIHLRLGELLTDTDPLRAVDHLRAALVDTEDLRGRAKVAVRFALAALAARRSAEAVEILEPLVERLAEELGADPTDADHDLLQCARSAFLIVCFDSMGTIRRAGAFLRTLAEPVARTDADRQLLAMMAVADSLAGADPARAADRAERALLLDEDDLGGWAALASAFVLGLTGGAERGMAALDAMVARSSAAGRTWIRCLTLATRAVLSVAAGDFPTTAVDASLALAIARRESWHADLVMPTVGLAIALSHQGRADEADRMLAGLSGSGDRLETAVLEKHHYLMARATARAHLGDVDSALAHLRTCGRSLAEAGVRNPLFTPWWAEAVLLLADDGRPGEARPLVDHGAELAHAWNVPRARGLVLLARAAVSPLARQVEPLEEAVALLDAPDSRYDHHRAHRALGVALARLGDHRSARSHLRRATTLALRCGAVPAASASRELLRRAGGRAAADHQATALSAVEGRIARLAAAGETNREIAAALYLSTRAVESHLTNAYRKLGVAGRAGLGAALRDGAGGRAAS